MRSKIITFYSWKGGVGRTFALANIGVQLAVREALDNERPRRALDLI